MREEKPDVQGRCHRAESGKFDVKTEKVYTGNRTQDLQLRRQARYPYATTTTL